MFRPALFTCFLTLLLGNFTWGSEPPKTNPPIALSSIPLPPNQNDAAEFANALAASLASEEKIAGRYPVELVVVSASQSANNHCQSSSRKGSNKRQRRSGRRCR